MQKWELIQQQPLLSEIFKDPLVVSYKRSRSLKDIFVRAKLQDKWVLHDGHKSCVGKPPHYYYPCLPKMFECLFLRGTFAAKATFVLENTQDSFHLLN